MSATTRSFDAGTFAKTTPPIFRPPPFHWQAGGANADKSSSRKIAVEDWRIIANRGLNIEQNKQINKWSLYYSQSDKFLLKSTTSVRHCRSSIANITPSWPDIATEVV
jgi:hypothetical protein